MSPSMIATGSGLLAVPWTKISQLGACLCTTVATSLAKASMSDAPPSAQVPSAGSLKTSMPSTWMCKGGGSAASEAAGSSTEAVAARRPVAGPLPGSAELSRAAGRALRRRRSRAEAPRREHFERRLLHVPAVCEAGGELAPALVRVRVRVRVTVRLGLGSGLRFGFGLGLGTLTASEEGWVSSKKTREASVPPR